MTTRPVTSGGEAPPKIFFVPLEKCVGHSLKNLGPSENSSPHLVSQAGYGTDDNQMPLQTNCAQFRAVGTAYTRVVSDDMSGLEASCHVAFAIAKEKKTRTIWERLTKPYTRAYRKENKINNLRILFIKTSNTLSYPVIF